MKKNNYMILVGILFLIGAVCLFSCNGNRTTYSDNETHADYNINHYVDTIYGHIILSTVVESKYYNNVSISTLEIDNFDKIDND